MPPESEDIVELYVAGAPLVRGQRPVLMTLFALLEGTALRGMADARQEHRFYVLWLSREFSATLPWGVELSLRSLNGLWLRSAALGAGLERT